MPFFLQSSKDWMIVCFRSIITETRNNFFFIPPKIGKKGHHKKGHYDDEHKGHKGKHGHDSHFSHHDEHAKKGGKKGGSEQGYESKGHHK